METDMMDLGARIASSFVRFWRCQVVQLFEERNQRHQQHTIRLFGGE